MSKIGISLRRMGGSGGTPYLGMRLRMTPKVKVAVNPSELEGRRRLPANYKKKGSKKK